MEDNCEMVHCPYCHVSVLAYSICTYGVGQSGGIVIAKTICSVCEETINERLIDKDI